MFAAELRILPSDPAETARTEQGRTEHGRTGGAAPPDTTNPDRSDQGNGSRSRALLDASSQMIARTRARIATSLDRTDRTIKSVFRAEARMAKQATRAWHAYRHPVPRDGRQVVTPPADQEKRSTAATQAGERDATDPIEYGM
jgi:hypothetical protein